MRISVYGDPTESLLSVHSELLFTFLSLTLPYANWSFCHDSPQEIDVYPFTPNSGPTLYSYKKGLKQKFHKISNFSSRKMLESKRYRVAGLDNFQ